MQLLDPHVVDSGEFCSIELGALDPNILTDTAMVGSRARFLINIQIRTDEELADWEKAFRDTAHLIRTVRQRRDAIRKLGIAYDQSAEAVHSEPIRMLSASGRNGNGGEQR